LRNKFLGEKSGLSLIYSNTPAQLAEISLIIGHQDPIITSDFSKDGHLIVSATWQIVKLWDISNGKKLQQFEFDGYENQVYAVNLSPDGDHLVTASCNGTIKVWETESGKLLHSLKAFDPDYCQIILNFNTLTSLSFSPDGKTVVVSTPDSKFKLFDVKTGVLIKEINANLEQVSNFGLNVNFLYFNFSPDGRVLMTESPDNSVFLWDTRNGKQISRLEGHESDITSTDFSSDGDLIATASRDWDVKIWDIENGHLIHKFTHHLGPVETVEFSENDKRIITSSYDYTAKVWDVSGGTLLHTLANHNGPVIHASIISDDKTAFTVSQPDERKSTVSKSDSLLNRFIIKMWNSEIGEEFQKYTIKGEDDYFDIINSNQKMVVTKYSDTDVALSSSIDDKHGKSEYYLYVWRLKTN